MRLTSLVLDTFTLRRLEREASQVWDHVVQKGYVQEPLLIDQIGSARRALRCAGEFQTGGINTARPMALAQIVVACEQAFGFRPSNSQVVAALAMHDGYVAEMRFDENRSLPVAMAAILYVWSGALCHVVTSHEDRARSDVLTLQELFRQCGCSVAALALEMKVEAIREAYDKDIVYATSRHLMSDFMRDNVLLNGVAGSLRRKLWELRTPLDVHRPLMKGTFVALIDDVGAVLMDEATSPMTISAPGKASILTDVTQRARSLVDVFLAGRDYELTYQPNLIIRYTPDGESLLATSGSELPPFWRHESRCEDVFSAAILARDVFQRDRHYAVQQQRVIVLDETINKLMSGQSWHFGVIQAIEAKEGLSITIPPRTIARTVFQEFFPNYQRICGSGNELSGFRQELWRNYETQLLCLPGFSSGSQSLVHRYGFLISAAKMDALVESVVQLQREGLPVIVAGRRLRDIAEIVARLTHQGVNCNVIDGKDPFADMQTLSNTGRSGGVTVVAGVLGRHSTISIDFDDTKLGGVQVLLLEHHDSARADNLVSAWAASQQPGGKVQVFASLEDELLSSCPKMLATLLRYLATRPFFANRSMGLLVYFSQRSVRRQTRRYRGQLLERESQLDQQLAFLNKLNSDSGPRF